MSACDNISLDDCRSLPLSPFVLRRMFTLMIRQHYSNPSNFGVLKEQLGCFRYAEDGKGRSSGTLRVDPAFTNKFWEEASVPSVHVSINDMTFTPAYVANQNGFSDDNASVNLQWPATTQVQVSHIAEEYDQAFMLAESTLIFLCGISYAAYEQFQLSALIPQQITKPVLVERTPTAYRSDTVFTIGFQYGVTVSHESHRLKKMSWVSELES
jgi:hypothetical protein